MPYDWSCSVSKSRDCRSDATQNPICVNAQPRCADSGLSPATTCQDYANSKLHHKEKYDSGSQEQTLQLSPWGWRGHTMAQLMIQR
jgi:hypothetical protein